MNYDIGTELVLWAPRSPWAHEPRVVRIARMYKNGNFVLEPVQGVASRQQWRWGSRALIPGFGMLACFRPTGSEVGWRLFPASVLPALQASYEAAFKSRRRARTQQRLASRLANGVPISEEGLSEIEQILASKML